MLGHFLSSSSNILPAYSLHTVQTGSTHGVAPDLDLDVILASQQDTRVEPRWNFHCRLSRICQPRRRPCTPLSSVQYRKWRPSYFQTRTWSTFALINDREDDPLAIKNFFGRRLIHSSHRLTVLQCLERGAALLPGSNCAPTSETTSYSASSRNASCRGWMNASCSASLRLSDDMSVGSCEEYYVVSR